MSKPAQFHNNQSSSYLEIEAPDFLANQLVFGTRRRFLNRVLAGSCIATVASGSLLSVQHGRVLGQEARKSAAEPLNRFSRMVQEWFVEQIRQIETRQNAFRQKMLTKADAEAYVKSVQVRIRQSFGPEPERTPLKAEVTGIVERDSYRIEKVVFQSRPDFYVTANLYLPKNRQFPLPGVVGSCGHSTNGKAAEAYQSFAQGLARQGYVVLIFDPIGQGERLQYTDAEFKPRRGVGTAEHLYAGNQQFLVGEFFGSWRAWDGVRALDYLLSRPEVDHRHVGITGNSGGGTMSTWLCGLERRWTMAAPACFVTTFRRNLENELPADTEQCPPRAIGLGLDHADFLAAMAPKPVIILAKERDYFDVRGATEAYLRLKHLYTLLGAPDNIALHVGPTEHGYSQENREAMYRWFNRATQISSAQTEPAIVIEQDKDIECLPSGQVAERKSRTVFDFTKESSLALAKTRRVLSVDQLRLQVRSVLKVNELPQDVPEYRILRPGRSRGYPVAASTTYAVQTEPGIFALVTRLSEQAHMSRPPQRPGHAILYLAHHSADVELREEKLIEDLLKSHPASSFYACDVRGIGESRPDTCGSDQFLAPYGSDYFYAAHSLMLDRPYVGRKTFDALRVLQWLASNGHEQVHLVGKGWGAIPAAFAALLSPTVTQVTLKQGLTSYALVAESEEYNWPLSAFVPGILQHFDLPDVYSELERIKKLERISMQGPVAKW